MTDDSQAATRGSSEKSGKGVGVDFIVDTVKSPLILVIALSAALGLIIGMLLRGRHDPP
ncbi:MAG TPA: LapA family protein [Acidimicrobiia bacterium]